MIAEALLFPLAMALAMAIPKGSKNDRQLIEAVMKNAGCGVMDPVQKKVQYPKYKRKEVIYDGVPTTKEEKQEMRIGVRYIYSIPPGLPASQLPEKEESHAYWSNTLNKPVEIVFKKVLMINVYDDELPTKIPYKLIPEPNEEQLNDWSIPIGKAVSGWIWHSFDKVPHMTVAGTTRFGKTVLLRMILTYLITHYPDDIEIYIIDLKGGLEFERYKSLRQIKWVATNPHDAKDLLTYLSNEDIEKGPIGILERDFLYFKKHLISNIVETNIKKRRFVIVDEGAQLTPAGKGFESKEESQAKETSQQKLSRMAAVFGAVGLRVIFATQYPTSDTLPRNLKMNADAKIAFRLPAGYASGVAIDDYGAEKLPSDVPGRALFKTHMMREMQVPFITHKQMWERLAKYQDPIILEGEAENVLEYPEETESNRGNLEPPGPNEVRDEGTNSDRPPIRFESKRS